MTRTDSVKDMQQFIETFWANRARGLAQGIEALERASALAPLDPLAAMTALTDAASAEAFRLWADQAEFARQLTSATVGRHATPV